MSDPRVFGLEPYLSPGDYNTLTMAAYSVADNAAYRALINARGREISENAFARALKSVEPVDQGCVQDRAKLPPVAGPIAYMETTAFIEPAST
jgi:hypothetical protein